MNIYDKKKEIPTTSERGREDIECRTTEDSKEQLVPTEGHYPVMQQAESAHCSFFSFIAEEHLLEAQEFRRKGHNSQVPEVNLSLLVQLRETVDVAERLVRLHAMKKGDLIGHGCGQIIQLKKSIGKLSESTLQDWVGNELVGAGSAEEGLKKRGSRAALQSQVRRQESTLQALTRVANILDSIVDYSTPEII